MTDGLGEQTELLRRVGRRIEAVRAKHRPSLLDRLLDLTPSEARRQMASILRGEQETS